MKLIRLKLEFKNSNVYVLVPNWTKLSNSHKHLLSKFISDLPIYSKIVNTKPFCCIKDLKNNLNRYSYTTNNIEFIPFIPNIIAFFTEEQLNNFKEIMTVISFKEELNDNVSLFLKDYLNDFKVNNYYSAEIGKSVIDAEYLYKKNVNDFNIYTTDDVEKEINELMLNSKLSYIYDSFLKTNSNIFPTTFNCYIFYNYVLVVELDFFITKFSKHEEIIYNVLETVEVDFFSFEKIKLKMFEKCINLGLYDVLEVINKIKFIYSKVIIKAICNSTYE